MEFKKLESIEISGARVHNLKNLSLHIPLKKLISFAGPSGSGKTSLAFHTLLTESKRRFINSFPNSMKFFTERPAAVDVDKIFPVLPVFGLPQINPVLGSRSVVSDIMSLTESLQNYFFSFSKEYCPEHHEELVVKSISIQFQSLISNTPQAVFHLLAVPSEFQKIHGPQFLPVRSYSLKRKSIDSFDPGDDYWELLRFKSAHLEKVEKTFKELRLNELGINLYLWSEAMKVPQKLNLNFGKTCPKCDFKSYPVASVMAFSPYSALGACKACSGYGANLVYDENKLVDREKSISDGALKLLSYGPFDDFRQELLKLLKKKKIPIDIPIKNLGKDFFKLLDEGEGIFPGHKQLLKYLDSKKYKPAVRIFIRNLQKEEPCSACQSSRIQKDVHHFKVILKGQILGLSEIMSMTIGDLNQFFSDFSTGTSSHQKKLTKDIFEKLKVAQEMGLSHLSIIRKAKTLSAGEYQRLLLIKYLSFKGTDCLFVLDEPSLGLNQNEVNKLIEGLRALIDQGNTVIVIDHSEQIQLCADHLFVMGPGSGKNGGEIVFDGNPKQYFESKEKIIWQKHKSSHKYPRFIEVQSPEIFKKKYPDFKIPVEDLTWVTGPSGSGKTSLIIKTMANTLHYKLTGEWLTEDKFSVKSVDSPIDFDEILVISSDLNRFTSRSSIGTVTELASVIRKHFLKLPLAKSMNLKEGHLSSNSELGMCSRCEGRGSIIIEMQYLEDIVLECEECKGLKIKPLYANISDGKMTVAEAYNLPLSEVLERIDLTPKFRRVWDYLKILNLDYLSLDRSLNSLSGGERQRIYLLSKLLKNIQNSLLVFENISFGLSEKELKHLGEFFQNLVRLNNTIIIIDSSQCFRHLASWQLEILPEKIYLYPTKN